MSPISVHAASSGHELRRAHFLSRRVSVPGASSVLIEGSTIRRVRGSPTKSFGINGLLEPSIKGFPLHIVPQLAVWERLVLGSRRPAQIAED